MALAKSQRSLRSWTEQKWGTKSGKKSSETGERYLPEKAIKSLSDSEYAATTAKKRKDTAAGKQHSKQPKRIAKKTRGARQFKNTGEIVSPYDNYFQYFQPQFQVAYNNNEQFKGAVDNNRQKIVKWSTSSVGKHNDKYYILPTRSDETGEELRGTDRLNQILPLIEEGTIQGYSSKKQAEADRTKLISNLFSSIIQSKIN